MLKKLRELSNNEFVKDLIITSLGQVIILIVVFGLNKLLSIKLTVSQYGEYNIARRTSGLITYVMACGMGIAIPKYIAMYREKKDEENESKYLISSIIIISIISMFIFLIFMIFKNKWSYIIFGSEYYNKFIFPILLYSYSSALVNFIYSYYRGMNRFYMYSISQIFIQLITFICTIIFAKNVIILMYAWGVTIGCYGLYIVLKIWKKNYTILKNKYNLIVGTTIKELLRFCVPRIVGEFILFSYTLIPLIIINRRLNIEMAAYFGICISINSMISPLFSFIGVALLPLVSRSVVSNNLSDIENKINILSKLYFIIGLGCITSNYQPAINCVRIMIISILPNAYYLLFRNPIDAMSSRAYNTINLLISFIVLNILVLISSSVNQYAWSFVISYTILGVLSLRSWEKCKKVRTVNLCNIE